MVFGGAGGRYVGSLAWEMNKLEEKKRKKLGHTLYALPFVPLHFVLRFSPPRGVVHVLVVSRRVLVTLCRPLAVLGPGRVVLTHRG